jgi:hypothetical protein
MAAPLPRKVTDLIGRQVYWQDKAEDTPSVATVVDARWSDTVVRDRLGVEFCLDVGEHELRWSGPYPAPADDADEPE